MGNTHGDFLRMRESSGTVNLRSAADKPQFSFPNGLKMLWLRRPGQKMVILDLCARQTRRLPQSWRSFPLSLALSPVIDCRA